MPNCTTFILVFFLLINVYMYFCEMIFAIFCLYFMHILFMLVMNVLFSVVLININLLAYVLAYLQWHTTDQHVSRVFHNVDGKRCPFSSVALNPLDQYHLF